MDTVETLTPAELYWTSMQAQQWTATWTTSADDCQEAQSALSMGKLRWVQDRGHDFD